MARTQAENYPEIRKEILRRSAALFAARGYPNATIADLAAANGMSRGLLYHYFASKEAILSEMLHEHLDMMLAQLREAAATGDTLEARFRSAVARMCVINAGSQDLQVVLLHDLQNLGDDDRAAIVEKQRAILAVIGGLVADLDAGRTPPDARPAQTMMLIGMINYTYVWYDPEGPVGPEAYAAMVADTFLAGLGR
mgnify:CR=1 FL=1